MTLMSRWLCNKELSKQKSQTTTSESNLPSPTQHYLSNASAMSLRQTADNFALQDGVVGIISMLGPKSGIGDKLNTVFFTNTSKLGCGF